jgi:hypothetical protein
LRAGRISTRTEIGFPSIGLDGPGMSTAPPAAGTSITTPPLGTDPASLVMNVNDPWVPRRSGTHIPAIITPSIFSTGNVMGTRRTEADTP